MAAHKMYGPKGAAGLIVNGETLSALLELEKAEGTPNVPAIAGFAEACRLRRLDMLDEFDRVGRLRDRLEELLVGKIDGLFVNGDRSNRMANNLHVSIDGVPNEAVVARLSRSVALSTGAACRWGTDEPSHVLRAMALPDKLVEGALRLGLGRQTTARDVELAAELIAAAVEDTRQAMRGTSTSSFRRSSRRSRQDREKVSDFILPARSRATTAHRFASKGPLPTEISRRSYCYWRQQREYSAN